jgi:hypothetical protein
MDIDEKSMFEYCDLILQELVVTKEKHITEIIAREKLNINVGTFGTCCKYMSSVEHFTIGDMSFLQITPLGEFFIKSGGV